MQYGGSEERESRKGRSMKLGRCIGIAILVALSVPAPAQQAGAAWSADYRELTDTKPHDNEEAWGKMRQPTMLGWGSVDVRYAKLDIPAVERKRTMTLSAWQGERVHAQAVLWTNVDLTDVEVVASELRHGQSVIPSSSVSTHFVRYVMTDELNKSGNNSGGCGQRANKAEWDSSLVADVLDIVERRDVNARSTQPIWVKVNVPRGIAPGKYRGTITVSGKNIEAQRLRLEVDVLERELPNPEDWALHVDFWQNPYAVARYHGVPLWSREHFDRLRPLMKMLADIGQRSITASIMHKPWNGQTEDHFDSMISRIKDIDGTWSYDYTVFDRWVTFMMEEVGIDGMICCYTMIPWNLRFDYYDVATSRVQFISAKPGEDAYSDYWVAFLSDFARHLRQKGWFAKTFISMDERPLEDMREAIKVIRSADPEFKISLAGNYHPEIADALDYLSIPYGQTFPDGAVAERRGRGQLSCVYTCCMERFPNIFTFSPPAEATWTALHALAAGYDGFLRWSVCAWTSDPLRDSRFRLFAAGDTYCIYPGPRSSIRFERLMEGFQNCEKARILRMELEEKGETKQLAILEDALSKFTTDGQHGTPGQAHSAVAHIGKLLNSL